MPKRRSKKPSAKSRAKKHSSKGRGVKSWFAALDRVHPNGFPEFRPVPIEGEPLSETIARDRR